MGLRGKKEERKQKEKGKSQWAWLIHERVCCCFACILRILGGWSKFLVPAELIGAPLSHNFYLGG